MKVTMLLADAAQVADGKLYVMGGGWSIARGLTPQALAMKLEVPWDQANRAHSWSVELLNEDGDLVEVPGPNGDQPLRIEGKFEVGRPAGLKPGTPLDVPLAIYFGLLPLQAGRYTWRLSIDNKTDENWQISFSLFE